MCRLMYTRGEGGGGLGVGGSPVVQHVSGLEFKCVGCRCIVFAG